MNIYTWFNIFNQNDFDATGLTSRSVTLNLGDIGEKTILITKGEGYGITYEGVFLAANLNDKNPFEFEGLAVFVKENGDTYLGILVVEDS